MASPAPAARASGAAERAPCGGGALTGLYHGAVVRSGHRLTRRLLAPLAGLALAGALIAGCAPSPGAAATVGNDVISESSVATVVAELGPFLSEPLTPSAAIGELVAAPVILDVAAGAGFGSSQDDASATLEALAGQAGREPAEYSEDTLLVAQSILARSEMQSAPDAADLFDEVETQIAALDVTVSPRYGEWDGRSVVAVVPDWIVQPVDESA